MPKHYSYFVVNVFTSNTFEGNPLAVVLNSDGMSDALMLKIAQEFNLSETVFMAKHDPSSSSVPIRIFTPTGELPFAGHPTIGSAFVVNQIRQVTQPVILDEKIGQVLVRVLDDSREIRYELTAPQVPRRVSAQLPSLSELAMTLGVEPSALLGEPQVWSGGVPFIMVHCASPETIKQIQFNQVYASEVFQGTQVKDVYACACDALGQWYVRAFIPSMAVSEDPATGSAAVAFAGFLAETILPTTATGHFKFTIYQGAEIGRPSTIYLSLEVEQGALMTVRVAGAAVLYMQGDMLLHD